MNRNTDQEQKRNLKNLNLPEAVKVARRDVAQCAQRVETVQLGLRNAHARLDELEKRVIAEQLDS